MQYIHILPWRTNWKDAVWLRKQLIHIILLTPDVHVSSELQSSKSQPLDGMVASLLKRNSDKVMHLNNLFTD